MGRKAICILSMIAVAVVVAISAAAMTGTEAIKERQEAMEGIGNGMKSLGAIVKKETPFDAKVVQTNAMMIADHLGEAAKLFPEGSDKGEVKTWAKPEIWTDRELFDKLLEKAQRAAVELGSVEDAEAFPAALGNLGNGCKSCHDTFRLPKN